MSDTTTNGIRIQVEPTYLPDRSGPGRYLFAYHVRISNLGDRKAQLISRRWVILDAEGNVETVEGPGVVGQQPVLEPGQSFEYSSFCPLPTPFGSMHGSYRMVLPDGQSFDAEIAPFHLAVPSSLN